MKVEFWGAAQTVTGSMHLVHWRGKRLLLDCGLFQGRRKLAFEINRKLPFAPSEVDAVVLSHAHIDHSGNLPSLVRNGFRGTIFATQPTRDLAEIMLLDSAKIQVSDVEYVNRKRSRAGQKLFEPLYVEADAVATLKQFRTAEFLSEFHPLPGIRCRFHVAGHMLGAASVEVLLENNGDRPTRLVFSGDIGRPNAPILKDPTTVDGANYLIMEATYGNRVHPPTQEVAAELLAAARETADAKGKLLIPAFSVGRTQEIVYHLNRLFERGKLPRIPVIVDSPLAVDASDIFRKHQRSLDAEAKAQAQSEDDRDPLAFKLLRYVRSAEESKKLNTYDGPAIIISASGMCESGRILHHLKNHAVKPNTTILFSGYQAPDTLGRRILEGTKRVRIFGDEFELKAKVLRLEATSGHADRNELLEWARATSYHGQLKQIALVHSDLDASRPFAALLKANGLGPVMIPAKGESMELK
jgi:metallo-beta-lactamase family protein